MHKQEQLKEAVRYIFTGGMTTVVNFIIYWLCTRFFHVYWVSANVLAWFGAVIFAYYMNQRYVFHSNPKNAWKEAAQFFFLRLLTLMIETALLFICIQWLMIPDIISKVIVSVITVAGNYVFCKFMIFYQKQ